jgi:PBP1b-binding outer membrane lipoprotein LpoB
MMKIVRYLLILFFITFIEGCSPTREASYKERAGIMMLKPEEIKRNKPYKPSKLKQKMHKKAKKSLLKGSYKTK